MAKIELKTLQFPSSEDIYALPTFYTLEDGAGNVEIVLSIDKPMINFTIGGTAYQAEYGMTWSEWLASDYNTYRYHNPYDTTGNVVAAEIDYSIYSFTLNDNAAHLDDRILGNADYTLTRVQVIFIDESYIGGSPDRKYFAPMGYTWNDWVNNESYTEGNYQHNIIGNTIITTFSYDNGYYGGFYVSDPYNNYFGDMYDLNFTLTAWVP